MPGCCNECEVEGGRLIPCIVSMAVQGNSKVHRTVSLAMICRRRNRPRFPKGEFPGRQRNQTRSNMGNQPGLEVDLSVQPKTSFHQSIINPACCEMDGSVEHSFDF